MVVVVPPPTSGEGTEGVAVTAVAVRATVACDSDFIKSTAARLARCYVHFSLSNSKPKKQTTRM